MILFNFFAESPCVDKWNLLRSLEVINIEVPKEDYEKGISKRKEQENVMKEGEENKTSEELKEMLENVEVPVD